jgi:putative hemolysin
MMEIIIVLILIAINGFFALSEIAFVSSRREFIESERDSGSKKADLVLQMMDQPDRFLSSIQVGITLIGVISGAYGGIAIADHVSKLVELAGLPHDITAKLSLVLVVGIITYLSIVLGELVPKTIGLKNPEKVILAVIPVVNIFSLLTHPVVSFLSWSTRFMVRMVGIKQTGIDSSDDPLREILGIAKAAAVKNKISREQEGIIMRAARLRSTKLSQIMVNRSEMRCLSTAMSLADALVAAHVHYHTRFPLTDGPSDTIIGYINFKDIVNTLRINPANPSLRGICRPMISFKETDTNNHVLRRLITTHQHIALVRNAANTVVGMITMEDILETIVGDIQDEYDIIPNHLYEISPGRFVAGGGVTLRKIRTIMGDFVPDDERTLDLWIRERLGANIKVDSVMKLTGASLNVRKVSRSHVYEAIIEKRG